MIHGYARVSTDGQRVAAQAKQLRGAGAERVERETANGAKSDRAALRRLLDPLVADDVLKVTRLDRLARSTRDLLNVLAQLDAMGARFRSLADTWADRTTAHGRLILTVLGRESLRNQRRHRERSEAIQRLSQPHDYPEMDDKSWKNPNISIGARLDGVASLAMTNRWRRYEILLRRLGGV